MYSNCKRQQAGFQPILTFPSDLFRIPHKFAYKITFTSNPSKSIKYYFKTITYIINFLCKGEEHFKITGELRDGLP